MNRDVGLTDYAKQNVLYSGESSSLVSKVFCWQMLMLGLMLI